MTKAELVEHIQAVGQNGNRPRCPLSKRQIRFVLDEVFKGIGDAICREKRFWVPGFGSFSVRWRKARMGTLPPATYPLGRRAGQPIKIPASKTIGFTPTKKLRKRL